MKKIISTLAALAACFAMKAQVPAFNPDGNFKIMQLTDLHLNPNYPKNVDEVLGRIDSMVSLESPDCIMITGDLVYGKPCEVVIRRLVEQLDSYSIPWAVMFGNHDAEQNLSRAEMSALYVQGKWCLNKLNDKGELADVEIPVLKDGKPLWYMYAMDSNDYSPIKGIGTYGYFSFEQVGWMLGCCKARTAEDGAVAPSVAFFHIPLTEYIDAWALLDNPRQGVRDRDHCIGLRGENVGHGALNTGMFAAMKQGGSIRGVFVGHDHDSDFVACYKGIALCYGRFSGSDTVYNNIPRGARFIELHAGSSEFSTWMRDDQGRMLRPVVSDGSTIRRDETRYAKGLYGSSK